MVNWQEAGKTWPLPHPHAVRLLRGLVRGKDYRHSNPQCEGGMPRAPREHGRRPPESSGRLAAGGKIFLSLPPEALEGLDPPGQTRRRAALQRD